MEAILPLFSLMNLSTLALTRYTPPQYGTSSASKFMPRFCTPFSVARISLYDFT